MANSIGVKRAYKLFVECTAPLVRSAIRQRAPDTVVKTICNGVGNV